MDNEKNSEVEELKKKIEELQAELYKEREKKQESKRSDDSQFFIDRYDAKINDLRQEIAELKAELKEKKSKPHQKGFFEKLFSFDDE